MNDKELVETGEQVVRKRGRPKGSGGNSRPDSSVTPTEPGANTEIITKTMRLWDLPSIDIQNNEQVAQRCTEYFRICAEEDMKPSVEGLAFALGINRTTLWEWRTGKYGKNTDVQNTLKKACEYLNMALVEYMQNGKINPIPALFLLKNNHGYTDKQEVVVTPNNPLGDGAERSQLEDKYTDTVVLDPVKEE